MTVSFEIDRQHSNTFPPFVDGCEHCLPSGWHGVVVPFATVTNGDSLTAFYHHGRCGNQWFTSWSARYAHTWQRVIGAAPVENGRRLAAVPTVEQIALPGPRGASGEIA